MFKKGDRVLLTEYGIKDASVSNLGANKIVTRLIGPFAVLKMVGDAYTLDILLTMRLHPTFYVGWLEKYRPAEIPEVTPGGVTRTSTPRPDVSPAPTGAAHTALS